MKLTVIMALAIIWSLHLFGQQTINENIFFDSDKYTLTTEAESVLAKCVEQVKDKEIKQITISGHADGSGREDYNTSLSQNRANAVWDYFVSKGVDQKKIQLEFHGQLEPAQTNDNEQGRKLNRRVNVEIVWMTSPSHEVAKETDLHFEKQAQVFTLIPNKDTTIKCAEGTVITIKANSFVDEATGKPVTDSIRFSVAEYYKISDMLLANLSTTSNGELLETGGMLNLKATANGRSLKLKKEEVVQIKFATEQKKADDFQLFTGSVTEQNHIDWKLQQAEKDKIYSEVDEIPIFFQSNLGTYLTKELMYPARARNRGIQGFVLVRICIDEKGEVKDPTIVKSVDADLDSAAIKPFKNMPRWIPGKRNGVPVKVYITFYANFYLSDDGKGLNERQQQDKFRQNFERKFTNAPLAKANSETVVRYLLDASSLGWINKDQFLKLSPCNDFKLRIDGNITNVKILFDEFNTLVDNSRVQNGEYIFPNIPLNEKVTIIAIKRVENQYFLAIKKTKTKRETEQDFTFQPMTLQVLKEEMKKLDR